jgi:Ca2+-binding RTX toxin-like protein
VVTWTTNGGETGGGIGILAQLYDAGGNKVGSEFQVNTYMPGSQSQEQVTALADGGFVVSWMSAGQDGSAYGIYSQRYDASAHAVGGEQRVNTYTTGDQTSPDIAALSGGGYVVTWTEDRNDGNASDVYSQLYAASGSPIGGEQRVNSTAAGSQNDPAITGLSDGGYMVAWTSSTGAYVQRFDASGDQVGSEVAVRSAGAFLDIAQLGSGGLVLVSSHSDGTDAGVYAQLLDSTGAAVGNEVLVNTVTFGDQLAGSVAALADGGYVVTWSSNTQFAGGGTFAQVFDSFGAKVGGEQQVSQTTERYYSGGSIATLENGHFVTAWSYDGSDHPGGIYARDFAPVPAATADSGKNSLSGTTGADTLDGGAGNDQIAGFSGNDILNGGAGSDNLFGGAGDDLLFGDRLNGFDNGTEVDHFSGGAGNDFIYSGYGDVVDGGDGFDTVAVSYVGASHGITGDTRDLHQGLSLADGAGSFLNVERFSDIALTAFDDKMVIGDQTDPAVVRSWDGNDYLIGQEVSITMYGGNGNDTLVGSTSDDVLYGESGNDILMGFLGNDQLWGGSGADRFLITHLSATPQIMDFEHGSDRIDLTALDANTAVGGDQAFNFIGSAKFSGAAGELRFVGSAGTGYHLEGDVNGDHVADFIIGLGSVSTVTASDLLL